MKNSIKTKDIRVGTIKKFVGKGLEHKSDYQYVLLVKEDNKYLDLFDELDEEKFAIFKRLPYSNTTLDGEDYGTKVYQVNGVFPKKNDECVLLVDVNFKNILNRDIISKDELKELTLKSKYFIRQRKEYALEKLKNLDRPISMLKVVINDTLEEKRILKKIK